jgi:hypothetical protein
VIISRWVFTDSLPGIITELARVDWPGTTDTGKQQIVLGCDWIGGHLRDVVAVYDLNAPPLPPLGPPAGDT